MATDDHTARERAKQHLGDKVFFNDKPIVHSGIYILHYKIYKIIVIINIFLFYYLENKYYKKIKFTINYLLYY